LTDKQLRQAQPPLKEIPSSALMRSASRFSALLRSGDFACCLLIIFIASLAALPLFLRNLPVGNDLVLHFRWSEQFFEGLQEGALYPRWLSRANNSQGSPVALYYPPLQFFVASAFKALVKDTFLSLWLSCWLALTLSGITMYGFSKSFLTKRLAVLAALLYVLSAYHIFDLYQGAALSEFWSFVWLPLVLDAIYKITKEQSWRHIARLAIGFALLLLTHLPISFALLLATPIYALILTRDWRRLTSIGAGFVLGSGISALFIVPVALESKYINIGKVLKFDYMNFFLFENMSLALKASFFSPDPTALP
jgi:uncharacterized membrane protein